VLSVIVTDFKYYSLADAHLAVGTVVVIDVLRAFTTAAYAFANGASKIHPVSSVEEALKLKSRISGSLIMGEVDGFKPESFDFGNSPTEINRQVLTGRTLIQRTSAGTQGVIRTMEADHQFAASFVLARATAMKIRQMNPDLVSFIVTGESMGRDGDEDLACGEYIEALIKGQNPDPNNYIERIESSTVAKSFRNGEVDYLSKQDMMLSKQVDHFSFFLPVQREHELLVIIKNIN
jgi:2-phosphosulfolactate phosphatase